MQLIHYKNELAGLIDVFRKKNNIIGFVPTMGALHEGHRSLLRSCRNNNMIAVASIFINPTQFNDKSDLKNYPHTIEKDLQIMEAENVDLVFCPDVNEMYPEPDTRVFNFGKLGEVMEGRHRPGHFNGVAQIVTKLFDVVKPHNAYFGEKDFQQLAILKFIVRTLNLPINIIPCPIVREVDGLALSSRNLLLTPEERKCAPLIFKTLFTALSLKEKLTIDQLISWVIEQINECSLLEVEYFQIVDDLSLQPVKNWADNCNKVGCISVKTGNIRLIDNIRFN